MKIIQTCWACNHENLFQFNAGWYSSEYHLMGWALSCLQFKKYYDSVVLHTDSATSKMLIDTLKLPYSEVICDLDQFNRQPPGLWGLTKIHTYSQQTSPFLHADGDVFIWKPFDEQLLKGGLIAQNLEIGTALYERLFKDLETQLSYCPIEIIEERKKREVIYAYNAGIFGGNDLSFFNLYTKTAKEFINRNRENISKIRLPTFNIYYEQYLFYCLAVRENKKVNVLIDDIIPDDQYKSFGDFTEVPYNKQFLHLIGPYKKTKNVCEQLANRLRQDYPEYYYRIISLFKHRNIPLKKDYYHSLSQPTEKNLVDRYFNLKANQQNVPLIISEANFNIETSPKAESKIVENVLLKFQNRNINSNDRDNLNEMLKNAKVFEAKIAEIVKINFSQYSKEYLYVRDIIHTNYFEYIFANKANSYDKTIVTDSVIQIVESEFDWSRFDVDDIFDLRKVSLNPNEKPSNFYICVIPECHNKGYSLMRIDDLEMRLLQILEKPITLKAILAEIKAVFDADDLNSSLVEFEMLIVGRIKFLLQAKIIKAAFI